MGSITVPSIRIGRTKHKTQTNLVSPVVLSYGIPIKHYTFRNPYVVAEHRQYTSLSGNRTISLKDAFPGRAKALYKNAVETQERASSYTYRQISYALTQTWYARNGLSLLRGFQTRACSVGSACLPFLWYSTYTPEDRCVSAPLQGEERKHQCEMSRTLRR